MKKIFTLFAALAMVMSMSAKPYLRGDFNGWETGNEFINNVCTIPLSANTKYEFKVDDNGDWSTSYGGATITESNCTNVSCPGSNNATIQTTKAGQYVFTWNASAKKISVTYPKEELPKKDITVKAKMPAHWTNTITAWVWTAEDGKGKAVTPTQEGDWYVVTQNTAVSYIIFRNGTDWTGDNNQTVNLQFSDNACIQLSQTGNAKATHTLVDCEDVTPEPDPDPTPDPEPEPEPDPTPGETKDITVKAQVPATWTNTITAWVWPTGGDGKVVVPTKGGNWYVVTENCAELNIIFRNGEDWNGDANQTVDMKFSENTCITIAAGAGKATYTTVDCEGGVTPEPDPTPDPDPTVTETVYFINNAKWEGEILAYAWSGDGETAVSNAAWPGLSATKEAEQIDGHDVYSYAAAQGTYEHIIFTNGTNQTTDLEWKNGAYYSIAVEEPTPDSTAVISYVLMGVGGDWTTGIAMTQNPNNQYEYVLLGQSIAEGDSLKVVTLTNGVQTAWCSNVDTFSTVSYQLAGEHNNIVLAPGKYDFYYKVADDLIYIGATSGPTPDPDPTPDSTVTETVYFINNAKWEGEILAYAWSGDGETAVSNAAWPGLSATKEAEQIDGHDVYSYAAAQGTYEHIIFTNGTNQTTDLEWKNGAYYSIAVEEPTPDPDPTPDSTATTWTVAGTMIFGTAWNPADATNDMKLLENGTYVWEKADIELAANAQILFKVVKNHAWGEEYPQPDNYLLTISESGIYTITITFNAETKEVSAVSTKTADKEVTVTLSYVLMGVGGDWTTGIPMTQNPDNENEYVLLGQAIAEGEVVKVATLTNGEPTFWCNNVDEYSVEHYYSDDSDRNIVLAPGTYDFYYKVADQLIYIGVSAEAPTALDNIDTTVAPAKLIENGQFFIIRNGVKYNANGAIVK